MCTGCIHPPPDLSTHSSQVSCRGNARITVGSNGSPLMTPAPPPRPNSPVPVTEGLRRPRVHAPEAMVAARDLQVRLNLAVHRVLVAEDPIEVEEIEEELTVRIERPIDEHQRDVEVAARKAEARGLVAAVEIAVVAEARVEADEPLVDVLRREIEAVIVKPEEAHGLAEVAHHGAAVQRRRRMRRTKPGAHVGVMEVLELPRVVELQRAAVGPGRVGRVVQMRRRLVDPE